MSHITSKSRSPATGRSAQKKSSLLTRAPLRQSAHNHPLPANIPKTNIVTTNEFFDPKIHSIYDLATGTWQYLVADPSTLHAIIIDSVLDYDATTRIISIKTAESLLSLIKVQNYTIDKILETHIHADHLTAASYLQNRLAEKQEFKPRIGIGKRITQVQELFAKKYGIAREVYEDVFDDLFEDDEQFTIGEMVVKVMHLPGHTPDHVGYVVGSKIP